MKKILIYFCSLVLSFVCFSHPASAGSGVWVDSADAELSLFVPAGNPDGIYSVASDVCIAQGGHIPTLHEYIHVRAEKSDQFSSAGLLTGDYWTSSSPDATHHYTEHMTNFPIYRMNSLDSVARTYFCVKSYTPPPDPPVYTSPDFGVSSYDKIVSIFTDTNAVVVGAGIPLFSIFEILIVSIIFVSLLISLVRSIRKSLSKAI